MSDTSTTSSQASRAARAPVYVYQYNRVLIQCNPDPSEPRPGTSRDSLPYIEPSSPRLERDSYDYRQWKEVLEQLERSRKLAAKFEKFAHSEIMAQRGEREETLQTIENAVGLMHAGVQNLHRAKYEVEKLRRAVLRMQRQRETRYRWIINRPGFNNYRPNFQRVDNNQEPQRPQGPPGPPANDNQAAPRRHYPQAPYQLPANYQPPGNFNRNNIRPDANLQALRNWYQNRRYRNRPYNPSQYHWTRKPA